MQPGPVDWTQGGQAALLLVSRFLKLDASGSGHKVLLPKNI
jgi:hypothetical protein